MKKICILLLAALGLAISQTSDTLYVLQTTDIHGHIYPYDYYKDQADDKVGLAKIYTLVKKYRTEKRNVILLDSGDLLQGSPLVSHFNQYETDKPHPMILAMNYMGYDAFAVGNHDIEQGLFVYTRAEREAKFPFLSANAVMPDGRIFFSPYTVIERGNIRIGILGLTTPGIPMWLDESLYPGITWADMVETAQSFAPELRQKVDVLIGLFHAGFNAGYSQAQSEAAGLPNENASGLVAEQVPGFDLILAGHSHRAHPLPGSTEETASTELPLRLNAGSHGRNLAVAEFVLSRNGDLIKIVSARGWLESTANVEPAKEILQLTSYYHQKTLDSIAAVIGYSKTDLNAEEARFKDTAVMDLIHDAQLAHTGAEISFAACFNTNFSLSAGPLRKKDLFGIYVYDNTLYEVKMSGRQIKDFLEYASGYYELEEGKPKANPDMQGYNYDMAEGVSYTINLREKPGNRIQNLRLLRTGEPLELDKIYNVAMNSYRASGGGGHMQAAGAGNAEIIYKSSQDVRTILIDYIAEQDTLNLKPNGNWTLSY